MLLMRNNSAYYLGSVGLAVIPKSFPFESISVVCGESRLGWVPKGFE